MMLQSLITESDIPKYLPQRWKQREKYKTASPPPFDK